MPYWLPLLLALVLSACSAGRDASSVSPDGCDASDVCDEADAGDQGQGDTPSSLDDQLIAATLDELARGCDPLDPNYCLYPFPNDFFSIEDAGTDTGRRVNFVAAAMPRNAAGRAIDPTEWNRNDGFSPGALIETRVPGLSLDPALYEASNRPLPMLWQIHNSLDPRSIVIVVDATPTLPGTEIANPAYGKQHLVWAELDANTTKFGICDAADPVATLADLGGFGELEQVATEVTALCEGSLPIDPVQDGFQSDPGPALLIHPGVNLEEGHRYIVALRGLRDATGELLTPAPAFRVYRDQIPSLLPNIEQRRAAMEALFEELANSEAAVAREELYLAWDFTVVSERNLTERVLHMRNEAFANYLPTVGGVPQFSVDSVENYVLDGDDCLGSSQDDNDPGRGDRNTDNCIARRVVGTITVPSYMTLPRTDNPLTDLVNDGGSPLPVNQYVGGRLYYDEFDGDELPDVNPVTSTESFAYTCNIPRSAFAGAIDPLLATEVVPARASLYGHGLLGSQGEGRNQAQLKRFANEHNYMFCMTDWIGMSHYDLANVAAILADMSNFPSLADRAQQGFLNKMFLARLIKDPNGFAAHPAFQLNGTALHRTGEVYYDGNSQGGIMGGSLVAVSPDIQRGSLGVVGMNYSTLLSRSTDFAPFGAIYYSAYPASLDQQFVFSLIQMLWDRAENNGYAQHLGDGETANPRIGLANRALPGLPDGAYDVARGPFNPALVRMPDKQILLHPAFGDHQVTHWSAEVMARTIGANGYDVDFRALADAGSSNGEVVYVYADQAAWLAQRAPDEVDFFGLDVLDYADETVIGGSGFVIWDEGKTEVPPLDNTFPAADPFDPHEYPRRTMAARCQKARFLRADGRLVDVKAIPNDASQPCPLQDGAGQAFTP